MPTSNEFIERIGSQIAGCGGTYRKMFGEYAVYVDGKVVALVCDNRFLVKITDGSAEMLPDAVCELPYDGGKPMLRVTDLDDSAFLCELLVRVAAELPAPKPKKPRKA